MLVRCLFHKISTSNFYRHFQEKTDIREIVADGPQSCGCRKRIPFLKHGVQWIRKVDWKGAFTLFFQCLTFLACFVWPQVQCLLIPLCSLIWCVGCSSVVFWLFTLPECVRDAPVYFCGVFVVVTGICQSYISRFLRGEYFDMSGRSRLAIIKWYLAYRSRPHTRGT